MIKMNLIQESTSEWASPILIVLKEDPNEPTKIKRRFVTDFRELNAHTVKDPYPMPLIADIMLSFASAKYFTAFDLNSGFWQISLRSTDRMKTAFVILYGLYEYVVIAMGLTNSPATF
ncbi:gag-pol fusion protein-like protein, partial [Dinothrombium tinctorium]